MISTIVNLFFLGPLFGLSFAWLIPSTAPQYLWRNERARVWSTIAAFITGPLVAGWLFGGAAAALSAGGTYLSAAGLIGYWRDPQFPAQVARWRQRLLRTLTVLFTGLLKDSATSEPEADSGTHEQSARGGRDRFATQHGAPAAAEQSATAVPDAQVLSWAGWPKSANKLAVQPDEEPDAQLLANLLQQVLKLQQWAARPDCERKALGALVSDTKATEQALLAAVGQVRDGTVNWNDIKSHVEGLKRHELPADVAAALETLVIKHGKGVATSQRTVAALSEKLKGNRNALASQLSNPPTSPDEAILSADVALSEAARATASDK